MPFVHSITARPPARFDDEPWTEARIEESADNVTFAECETVALAPLDADPTLPQLRNLTTDEATIEEGWFRVVWIDANTAESPASSSIYSPSGADDGYPGVDALVEASDLEELITLATEDPPMSKVAPLRLSAIRVIEDFCGQPFNEVTETRKLDGNGGLRLPLPWRLGSLTTLVVAGASIDAGDVELTHDHDALYVVDDALTSNWYEQAIRDGGGLRFALGYGTVTITGKWGWTTAELDPDDIENPIAIAIRKDMEDQALALAHGLAGTARAQHKLGLDTISEGPLLASQTLTPVTLSQEIQSILRDFIWQPTAVVA